MHGLECRTFALATAEKGAVDWSTEPATTIAGAPAEAGHLLRYDGRLDVGGEVPAATRRPHFPHSQGQRAR